MTAYAIHYGKMRFKGGPLDGKTYEGGDGVVLCLDRDDRRAYVYRAVHPPHRGLRKHSAMCVDFCFGPLSKRELRICSEQKHCVEVTK